MTKNEVLSKGCGCGSKGKGTPPKPNTGGSK